MDQQVSPFYQNFLMVTSSYHSNVTPIRALNAEKKEKVLLYVCIIALPVSLLWIKVCIISICFAKLIPVIALDLYFTTQSTVLFYCILVHL